MLEKRGMYVCKICKYGPAHGRSHNPSGGSANSCSPIHNSSKDELGWDENSLEASEKELARSGSFASESRGNHQSMGRGKPMSAMAQSGASGFPGKRRRLGMVGRPPGSFSGSSAYSSLSPNSSKPGSMGEKPLGQAVTTMAAAIASKKRGKILSSKARTDQSASQEEQSSGTELGSIWRLGCAIRGERRHTTKELSGLLYPGTGNHCGERVAG